MPKLSAVVITKNEQARIAVCLDSLKSFVDELVVIDDASVDSTVRICESYGAKVLVNPSGGDFDRQRNLGLELAEGQWILQMDADEIIPPQTAQDIRRAVESPGDYAAFKIRRRNFLLGQALTHAGSYDWMTKLLKKGRAAYVGQNVHETLNIDGPVGEIPGQVNHYPFSSISQVLERWNFYTGVEARAYLRDFGQVKAKQVRYRLTLKAVKIFWKLYFKKKGYKDGMAGLAWCVLKVMESQMKWLKIWEQASAQGKLVL